MEAARAAGLEVDAFAPRLSFFFNAHAHLFEEVAKFRAARRLWARIMRDRFGARDPRSQMLRFHAQTAGSTLTALEPLNNVARTTVEALAAILGGAQSIHTNGYDEALSLPTETSARVALRTQQILAHESGAGDIVDPLGGAYAIEALTSEDRGAGVGAARGDRSARRHGGGHRGGISPARDRAAGVRAPARRGDGRPGHRGRQPLPGCRWGDAPPLHRHDPARESAQLARLAELRARRAPEPWRAALDELRRRAAGTENVCPAILARREGAGHPGRNRGCPAHRLRGIPAFLVVEKSTGNDGEM